MIPGMMHWWKRTRGGSEEQGAWASCGPSSCGPRYQGHAGGYHASADDGLGSSFGVRRPLRFMAHKLELDEPQVSELAKILNDLKTERAQAAVDGQRTVSAFADALSGDTFDATRAQEGAKLRVQSAERLRDAVLQALERTHVLLRPEQRQRLAYLLRSGVLTI